MKLVIGGYAQGKLNYARFKYRAQDAVVWDGIIPNGVGIVPENIISEGTVPDHMITQESRVIINHFHNWVKKCLLEGGYPEEEIVSFLERNENCIIISNEVGNGIVPTDSFEREYRERMGRILVQLADRAEEVERVICGIGQKIK